MIYILVSKGSIAYKFKQFVFGSLHTNDDLQDQHITHKHLYACALQFYVKEQCKNTDWTIINCCIIWKLDYGFKRNFVKLIIGLSEFPLKIISDEFI